MPPVSKLQDMVKLSDYDVLYLLETGIYRVNLETAEVTGPLGKVLKTRGEGNGSQDYQFVSLKAGQKQRKIALHKLVWMAGTMSVVPPNFEVHHRDEDTTSNGFRNLMAIHKIDHKKVHADDATDTPF